MIDLTGPNWTMYHIEGPQDQSRQPGQIGNLKRQSLAKLAKCPERCLTRLYEGLTSPERSPQFGLHNNIHPKYVCHQASDVSYRPER